MRTRLGLVLIQGKSSTMNFTIVRSSSSDKVVVHDNNGKNHSYDMNGLTKTERNRVRELIVNAWSSEHGFATPY